MGSTTVKGNSKKVIILIIAIIFTSSIAAFFTMALFTLNKENIYYGVHIAGIDVGDLSKMEAREKLEGIYEKELDSLKFQMVYKDYNKEVDYRDLDYNYLYDEAIEKAYNMGREGNIFKRIKEIYDTKKESIEIDLKTKYNDEILDEIIIDIKENINRSPQNASIIRQNGAFNITKEVIGNEVEEEILIGLISQNIENLNTETIEIPVDKIEPEIREEALKNIKDIIGEFSTVFNAQVSGRSKNIDIASKSITQSLLMPGQEFSFNQKTGPRGVTEGYQEAPVIINGELVPGVGGGICQVSTTLYNAVVRANLQISNRRNHSIPVGYVPLGHDATVAYNYIDFTFVNNRKHPIYLESFVSGNRVFTRFYGRRENDPVIRLHSEVTEVIEPKMETKKDDTLFMGETKTEKQGKQGYRVSTYKIYSEAGKEVKRELISKDYYAPTNGLILEGTKEKPLDDKPAKKVEEDEKISKEEARDNPISTEEDEDMTE